MPRAGAVGADLCVFWQLPGCSGAYLYPSYFHWLKTAAGLPGGVKKKKKKILLNLKPRTERGNPDRSPRIWCPEREGRGMSRGRSRVQMRMVERKTKTQYEQHVSFSRRPLSSCWAGCQFACSLSTPGQIFFFFRRASTDWAASLGTPSVSQRATPPPGDQWPACLFFTRLEGQGTEGAREGGLGLACARSLADFFSSWFLNGSEQAKRVP